MKNIKRCPVCGQDINRRCVHCGKRIAGIGKDPAVTIRENMGMGPSAAIKAFASVCKNKTSMAAEFGISRNSLYSLIDRFGLQEVKFKGAHK